MMLRSPKVLELYIHMYACMYHITLPLYYNVIVLLSDYTLYNYTLYNYTFQINLLFLY